MKSLIASCGERFISNLFEVINNGLLFGLVICLILDFAGFKFPTIPLFGFIIILLSLV